MLSVSLSYSVFHTLHLTLQFKSSTQTPTSKTIKMISKNEEIIDLTADLSDLELPSQSSLSSAKKRPRASTDDDDRNPSPVLERNLNKKRMQHGLIEEPFAVKRDENHYRAVRYGGMSIEVRRPSALWSLWLTSRSTR